MVDLPEHLDDTAVVNARNENSEQVGEESRLLLEVERESLVVAAKYIRTAILEKYYKMVLHLDVRDFDDDVLELVVLPTIGRPLDHSKSSVVLAARERTGKGEGGESRTNSSYLMYRKTSSGQR